MFFFSDEEVQSLRHIILFILTIYFKYWFQCTIPEKAPNLDIDLIQRLFEYRQINEEFANSLLVVFLRHLWYLSETLVGLSFFDRSLDSSTKRCMVAALKKKGKNSNLRKFEANLNAVSQKDFSRVDKFVSSKTNIFLNSLFTSQSNEENHLIFLEVDPDEWIYDRNYLRTEEIVKSLKVDNDTAERGVALITRYNNTLTHNDTERQLVLQVVEKHQKEFPYRTTKTNMIKNLQPNLT